jgi:hypothetical protein
VGFCAKGWGCFEVVFASGGVFSLMAPSAAGRAGELPRETLANRCSVSRILASRSSSSDWPEETCSFLCSRSVGRSRGMGYEGRGILLLYGLRQAVQTSTAGAHAQAEHGVEVGSEALSHGACDA